MKRSRVLVPPSAAALLAAAVLALSPASRAEIVERIVARVNGDIVTQSEFEARQLAAVQAARIAPSEIERYLRQNNSRILQEAVDDLLIVQRAADLGIRLRPEYVVEIIEGIKKENNIADDAELRRQLRREGMTLDDLKRNIERSVLRRQVLSRELEPKAAVTDADARAAYEASLAEYTRSASVHLQEIVVPDAALAAEVVRGARGGEDFGALARAHSTAGSRSTGGDLGKVARGDMNPALEEVVSALPPGGVSEPIPTDNGFRIVRVVSREEQSITPFDEVREDLKKRLAQQRMASAYEDYVQGLRKASEKTTQVTVSEVAVDIPDLPPPGLATPGLTPPPVAPVPAVPGVDASEISTTPQARPERVAPPELPGQAAPAPAPSPSPAPRP